MEDVMLMMSIHAEHVNEIFSGRKKYEVRKVKPKLEPPFSVPVYCTQAKKFEKCGSVYAAHDGLWKLEGVSTLFGYGIDAGFKAWGDGIHVEKLNGTVCGEFLCDRIEEFSFSGYEGEYRVNDIQLGEMRMNHPDLISYGKGEPLYGLHILSAVLYDKPKSINDFLLPLRAAGNKRDDEGYRFCDGCDHAFWGDKADGEYGVLKSCSYDGVCEHRAIKRAPQMYCKVVRRF